MRPFKLSCNPVPTMKPVELMERAITHSGERDAIVLDQFGGAGSTLIACEATERRARLLELDSKYVDVIVKRWQHYQGWRAVLEVEGRYFEQIALERS